MNIKDALSAIKQNKKVRHASWEKESFIALNDTGTILFYTLESCAFLIEPDILSSNDWQTLDGSHKELDFIKALSLLKQGHKLIHEDYTNGCEYIEMESNHYGSSQQIIQRTLAEREFNIDHMSLFSNEWTEVK